MYKWHVCAYCTPTIFMNENIKMLIIREHGWRYTVLETVIKHWKQRMRQMVGVFWCHSGQLYSQVPQPSAGCWEQPCSSLLRLLLPPGNLLQKGDRAPRLGAWMHACLCAESCSYIRDITLPKFGPTSVCMWGWHLPTDEQKATELTS